MWARSQTEERTQGAGIRKTISETGDEVAIELWHLSKSRNGYRHLYKSTVGERKEKSSRN